MSCFDKNSNLAQRAQQINDSLGAFILNPFAANAHSKKGKVIFHWISGVKRF